MKKTAKKLTLSRETLRHLAAGQARMAQGGQRDTVAQDADRDTASIIIDGPKPLTTDSVRVCCA